MHVSNCSLSLMLSFLPCFVDADRNHTCVKAIMVWRHCHTEVKLQFNVKLSTPGKTRSDQSNDYTPALALSSCCNVSGRDTEGLHHCLKWSLVWRFSYEHKPKKKVQALLVGQRASFISRLSAVPASFKVFCLRAYLSSLSFPLSFPITPFCPPALLSPSSSFLMPVCDLTPNIK